MKSTTYHGKCAVPASMLENVLAAASLLQVDPLFFAAAAEVAKLLQTVRTRALEDLFIFNDTAEGPRKWFGHWHDPGSPQEFGLSLEFVNAAGGVYALIINTKRFLSCFFF
jgi:hypothetical protein